MARLIAIIAAFLVLSVPAWPAEVIQRFLSEVTVNGDATIDVSETITVTVEGDQIKRGIFRDFPTRYQDTKGNDYEVGFDVTGVKRDGMAEPYEREDIANGVRIRIGKRDVLLSSGPHSYEIRYHATREIGFFDGYDEIYWNVTGNSWVFPISRAETIVHLPSGATILQHAEYTGAIGSKGRDFEVLEDHGATYRAATTRALAPGEGFTVAVGFTKGILTPPPPPPPEVDTSRQSLLALGGGLAFMLLYYVFAWLRVGRDPKGGAIIPLFSVPAELGAAGARYVWKHEFDARTFATGVIGLAAKGRFRIKGNGDFEIEKLKQAGPPLTIAETAMLKAHPGGVLAVNDKNHADIAAMRKALEEALRKDFGASTWRSNRGWFWAGVPLSLAALVPTLAYVRTEDFAFALIISLFCFTFWALFIWLLYLDVRAFFKPGMVRKIFSLLALLFLVPIVLGLPLLPIGWLADARDWTRALYTGGLTGLVTMHVLFSRWLTAPTVLGRKLMDQIEGLRLYMATAEEKRLDMLNPPDKTPELFERLLPYALALDCENQWSLKFAAVLAAAAYQGPAWYTGATSFDINDFGDFSSRLDSSRYDHTARTSSSGSSPGSFSGSSGGGSSGGGGGGGGGGGW
jgi:uncharacterized membrane protein YgcG